MCNEREALLDRYRTLVLEHAQRVSDFSVVAVDHLADERQNPNLDAAVAELDISRQAIKEARERLKRHTVEHGCDGLDASTKQLH